MKNRGWILAAALTAAFALSSTTALATPSFSAHGSVEQVYVTGLKPDTSVALVSSAGKTVQTRKATSLGGALFRGVKPGDGYKVRANGEQSDALKVLARSPAPPTTDIYTHPLPPPGSASLTPRDGTKLAIDVPPPQDVSGALPVGYLPGLPTG